MSLRRSGGGSRRERPGHTMPPIGHENPYFPYVTHPLTPCFPIYQRILCFTDTRARGRSEVRSESSDESTGALWASRMGKSSPSAPSSAPPSAPSSAPPSAPPSAPSLALVQDELCVEWFDSIYDEAGGLNALSGNEPSSVARLLSLVKVLSSNRGFSVSHPSCSMA